MFRKSFQILVATTLLALFAVVGYAALHLSGPDNSLAEAEKLMAQGQFATAIARLTLAEKAPSLREDPARLQHLWRLRCDANTALGNADAAIDDVQRLLDAGNGADESLLLEKVRLLALAGDSAQALAAARAFLEAHPGHSRGLELAGEAQQATYQTELKELRATIEHDLPTSAGDAAREALFRFLFRPAGDRAVDDAQNRLAAAYSEAPRLTAAWPPVLARLTTLRQQVQEAQTWFCSSLEAGGQPVAAFRGFALALEQSERTDDLLLACEIQRRSFEHSYVEEAGADAAWALYDLGLDEAVLATAERWLPKGAVARRLKDGTVGEAANDLLYGAALAAYRLGRLDLLQRYSGDLWQLQNALGINFYGTQITNALVQHLGKNVKNAEQTLRWAFDRAAHAPTVYGHPDPTVLVAPLLLDWMGRRGASEDETLKLFAAWKDARPTAIQPHVMLADYLLGRGRTAAARTALEDAAKVLPGDEDLFARRLEVHRRAVAGTKEDGASLLAQCRVRAQPKPEVTNPFGYLLCGEEALAQQVLPVAAACAREATVAMPSARQPRLLEARTAIARGDAAAAVQAIQRLLLVLPADAATARLELLATRGADLPMQEALARALPLVPPEPDLQGALLREALRDAPARASMFVTPLATAATAPAEHRALAAEALARAGDAAGAWPLLDGLAADAATLPPAARADLARAFGAALEADVAHLADGDDDAAAATRRIFALHLDVAPCAPPLLRTARTLADTHPRLAHVLVEQALAVADPEARDGAAYALAGHLALIAGEPCAAETRWLAAVSFADGREAAEDLARLCLVDGRLDRATQVFALTTQPKDPALTARLAGIAFAAGTVAAALAAEPADLLAHGVMATFGQPSLLDWKPASDPLQQERLELLSLLRDPAHAGEALRRVRGMIAAGGTGTTEQMLQARAMAASGDGPGAARIHDALLRAGCRSPVFWHEVALAAASPGYQLTEAMRHELFAPETIAALAVTPTTLAFAMNSIAEAFDAGGFAAPATQTRLSLWQQAPTTCRLTAADLTAIQRDLAPTAVFALLDQALAGPTPPPEVPTLEAMIAAARKIVAAAPDRAPALVSRAAALMQQHGAVGCIVHFVLDHDGNDAGAGAVGPRKAALRGHLTRVAAGLEDDTWLSATVRRLLADGGADTLLGQLGDVLAQHPTSLLLWQARATIAAGTPDAARTIDELRRVLNHAENPDATLAFVTLAAESGWLVPADAAALAALPEAMRSGPRGQLATALVCLRQGRADDALAAFAKAPPTLSPHQELLRALAWLQSTRAEGSDTARELLARLDRDYPSSSAARYAGSFARQLAPR